MCMKLAHALPDSIFNRGSLLLVAFALSFPFLHMYTCTHTHTLHTPTYTRANAHIVVFAGELGTVAVCCCLLQFVAATWRMRYQTYTHPPRRQFHAHTRAPTCIQTHAHTHTRTHTLSFSLSHTTLSSHRNRSQTSAHPYITHPDIRTLTSAHPHSHIHTFAHPHIRTSTHPDIRILTSVH